MLDRRMLFVLVECMTTFRRIHSTDYTSQYGGHSRVKCFNFFEHRYAPFAITKMLYLIGKAGLAAVKKRFSYLRCTKLWRY